MFQFKRYQDIFAQHQLDRFESLWQKPIDWFEEPNRRRGGWSGVGQLQLSTADGDVHTFVKKQENHGRRTFKHPIKGEPTFRREFERLAFLADNQVNVPKVVCYGEQRAGDVDRAILVTETLLGFVPLDEVAKAWHTKQSVTRRQKRTLLAAIAKTLRHFHQTGLTHRALYEKHIFIKAEEQQPEVALIDLEKARFTWLPFYRTYFDLAALNRHALYWSRSDRLYFFLQYFQVKRLTWLLRVLCRRILKRSARR